MRSPILRRLPDANRAAARRAAPAGQTLVEFAVVALAATALVGAVLTFGFLSFGANVLQQAADVGARELARLPLPPTAAFPELGATGRSGTDPDGTTASGGPNLFADPDVRSELFDERHLVVDLASVADLDAHFASLPLINRLLRPLMVVEDVAVDGVPTRLLRYSGALVRNESTGQLAVLVPRVVSRDDATGTETAIEWHAVVEEIRDAAGGGPFDALAPVTGTDPGMVALRINYPFQTAAAVAARYELPGGGFTGDPRETVGTDVANLPVQASDGSFAPPAPYRLVVAADDVQEGYRLHSGRYGLGRLEAFGTQVRPYRKVLAAQAFSRREVFAP